MQDFLVNNNYYVCEYHRSGVDFTTKWLWFGWKEQKADKIGKRCWKSEAHENSIEEVSNCIFPTFLNGTSLIGSISSCGWKGEKIWEISKMHRRKKSGSKRKGKAINQFFVSRQNMKKKSCLCQSAHTNKSRSLPTFNELSSREHEKFR